IITTMSWAGTTFCAVAMTCARIGLPPISCRTLGCFDLSRVPLPAAMIAMAIRGRCGFDREDFDLVFGVFTMLSQYTANFACQWRAGRPRPATHRWTGETPVAPQINPESPAGPALAPSAPSGRARRGR